MSKHYFTFGYGRIERNNFICIEAASAAEARDKMFAARGLRWAMQYTEAEFEPQRIEYNLVEIPL